jgi:MoaA/NifB/PqqE/SkfB family radical SAM enzyme
MKDNFCPSPWSTTFIESTGKHIPCCLYRTQHLGADIDHNSDNKKKLRLRFLNNETPEACQCFEIEDNGGFSLRQTLLQGFSKTMFVEQTQADGYTTYFPKSIDLTLGNKCNLACIMCWPPSSTGWTNDWEHISKWDFGQTGVFAEKVNNKMRVIGTDWFDNPEIQEKVFVMVSQAAAQHKGLDLKLLGGEFFLRQDALYVLERFGNIPNVYVKVFSNGTSIHQKEIDLLGRLTNVKLILSIDGVGDVIEYQRYPCKWNVVENTAKLVKPWVKQVFITVTAFNVFNVSDVLEWCNANDFSANINPAFGFNRYSPRVLPLPIREKAANKILDYYNTNKPNIISEENVMGFYGSLVTPGDGDPKEFLKYAKLLDDIRGTSFKRVFSELYIELRKYGFIVNETIQRRR